MSSVETRVQIEAFGSVKPPGSIGARLVPFLISALALIVPVIVTLGIYWARQSFYHQDPSAFVVGSPTISRAISEPGIANAFAVTMSFASALLALVCFRIIVLYHATIEAAFQYEPRISLVAKWILCLAAVAEGCSIAGMVSLSWLTERLLHIGASYLFFFGQASAIFCSGLICRMLLEDSRLRLCIWLAGEWAIAETQPVAI